MSPATTTTVASPDAIERQLWEAVMPRQLELFTTQLRSLRGRSEFYRDRLDAAGIGEAFVAQSWDDLLAIPLTTKADIRESLAAERPLGRHLAVPLRDVAQIQATSGTTGSPSYLGLTEADLETWAELGARALRTAGVAPGDRILHAWSMSKGFTGGVPVVRMLRRAGATVLPIGAEAGVERLLVVASELGATGMCSAPNFAVYVGEKAPEILGVPCRCARFAHPRRWGRAGWWDSSRPCAPRRALGGNLRRGSWELRCRDTRLGGVRGGWGDAFHRSGHRAGRAHRS